MRELTIDKKEVNGSIDALIDILNKKFEMNDKRLERIEDKVDAQHEMLLKMQLSIDSIESKMLTREEFYNTLKEYPTRKEMDDRFQDLGESLNTRFDKVDKRMNSIETLTVNTANNLTKTNEKLDDLIEKLDNDEQ